MRYRSNEAVETLGNFALHTVVGKLWWTIMFLVALVLIILGTFLLQYIDIAFNNDSQHQIKVLFIVVAVIGFLLSTFFAFFLSSRIQQPLLALKKRRIPLQAVIIRQKWKFVLRMRLVILPKRLTI